MLFSLFRFVCAVSFLWLQLPWIVVSVHVCACVRACVYVRACALIGACCINSNDGRRRLLWSHFGQSSSLVVSSPSRCGSRSSLRITLIFLPSIHHQHVTAVAELLLSLPLTYFNMFSTNSSQCLRHWTAVAPQSKKRLVQGEPQPGGGGWRSEWGSFSSPAFPQNHNKHGKKGSKGGKCLVEGQGSEVGTVQTGWRLY